MRKLNRTQSVIYLLGGLLMVVGAGCFTFLFHQPFMCWVYLLGALMFTIVQSMQLYEGKDITIRRLKHIQGLGNLCFVLAGLLMIDHVSHFLLPLFRNAEGTGLYNYQTYIVNKWVVLLLIGALLQMYTMHRLDYELRKNADKSKNT